LSEPEFSTQPEHGRPDARTRVLLVRHAEVENPLHVLYGHLDGFGLSARGRLQAEALGRRFREAGLRRIVHSPLQRAVEPDPALREADFSRYLQGVTYWQIPVRRPLWFVHRARRGMVPGDETVDRMGGRVLEVMQRVAAEHPGELSALISHADPLQAAWVLLDHRPHTDREMVRKAVGRAGVLAVDLEGTRIVSVEYTPTPEVTVEPQTAAAAS
jgi:broad specificity phosphatase PhoE